MLYIHVEFLRQQVLVLVALVPRVVTSHPHRCLSWYRFLPRRRCLSIEQIMHAEDVLDDTEGFVVSDSTEA